MTNSKAMLTRTLSVIVFIIGCVLLGINNTSLPSFIPYVFIFISVITFVASMRK
ncbi:hypothetical protein J2W98_003648 [Paenibacillus peoriae]|uniref:Uncharacterized protein n=1 Tax=Paenibacillus peoriae TaxID=59893 RepID=A0ABU1QI92_9BACL|nr:hypothetical protein [Paenibacillus peoriae]